MKIEELNKQFKDLRNVKGQQQEKKKVKHSDLTTVKRNEPLKMPNLEAMQL